MTATNQYVFFWGDNDIFSNFYSCTFQFKSKSFINSEQAFMWVKAMFFKDQAIADAIMKSATPAQAKKFGRMISNFDVTRWDGVSEQVMYDVNYAKYTQNSLLLEGLLKTRGKTLVEASPFDKIWGIGLRSDDPRALDSNYWEGENKLGYVLTRLRDTLLNSVADPT